MQPNFIHDKRKKQCHKIVRAEECDKNDDNGVSTHASHRKLQQSRIRLSCTTVVHPPIPNIKLTGCPSENSKSDPLSNVPDLGSADFLCLTSRTTVCVGWLESIQMRSATAVIW